MNRCIVLRMLSRVCCLLVCASCFLVGKKVCAQKVATYLLDTAPSTSSFESYRISFSTSSKAVTVSFPLGGRHAFNVRAEYFRTASIPKLNEKVWDVKADWKFRSVPITASYTYALPSPTSRLVPVVGAGVSAHIFKETHAAGFGTQPFITAPIVPVDLNLQDTYGVKYGAELSLGLRTQVTPHLFLMAQGRYRYINCSAQSSSLGNYGSGAVNVFDFSVDIGFGL